MAQGCGYSSVAGFNPFFDRTTLFSSVLHACFRKITHVLHGPKLKSVMNFLSNYADTPFSNPFLTWPHLLIFLQAKAGFFLCCHKDNVCYEPKQLFQGQVTDWLGILHFSKLPHVCKKQQQSFDHVCVMQYNPFQQLRKNLFFLLLPGPLSS